MDEFFDFDSAANSMDPAGFSNNAFDNFDMNLTLADAGRDEDAFLCLAHFTKDAPDHQISFDLHSPIATGRRVADDSGFPAWLDDRDVPQLTCQSCLEKGFHCKSIKSGTYKGSCTSCVALDGICSLVINGSPCDGDDEYCDRLEDQSLPRDSPEDLSNAADKIAENGVAIKSSHSSASDLQVLRSLTEGDADSGGQTKSGTRFSRESLRILRGWLTSHYRLPYPTDEDKETLQKQTGLSKTQISNWIANARRRGKVRAPRTVSPGPKSLSSPIDIPRRGTPIPRDMTKMNPLERWENSPPEHEAASVTAIANAVSSSRLLSGHGSPELDYDNGDSDSVAARSCNRSSTSGFGTSGSSGDSFASAFSYDSKNSFGPLAARGRRRRGQRRQITKPTLQNIAAPATPRKFQCTFCTESFKTKHDWQRHEKSLHLSLERWICAANGPTILSPETNTPVCAFCGVSNSDEAHLEFHNFGNCAERTLEERTFYRKDHLRQHLLLVHDSKFNSWSMDAWKVAAPPMKSRCGFCDITMLTWETRVDHLAKHFKSGSDMKDWKGDWGFEPQVLALVENGIPPYLINFDRNTPKPYKASKENIESQRQPFDLVKMGLVDFINERVASGETPTDDDLLREARQIYKSLDGAAKGKRYRGVSWFRDLFMTGTPYIGPKNTERSLLMSFQSDPTCGTGRCCPNEMKLTEFVVARLAIGAPPMTHELQNEACRILAEAEQKSTFPCEPAMAWFNHLIKSSNGWLDDFCRRVGLPLQSELGQNDTRFATGLEYDTYNGAQLRKELTDYVNMCATEGLPQPSDADLQRQARISMFGVDDAQYQTVADNPDWLKQFKHRYDHLTHATEPRANDLTGGSVSDEMLSAYALFGGYTAEIAESPKDSKKTLHWDISPSPVPGSTGASNPDSSKVNTYDPKANSVVLFERLALPLYPQNIIPEPYNSNHVPPKADSHNTNSAASRRYFFSDANCYRRLMYELSRFVASCLSPNNPNAHIPTDEEIQRQARWILYDDDDPWNQTAADNEEWLSRFKRDVGVLAADHNPGLGVKNMNDLQPGPEGWLPCDGGHGYDTNIRNL